MPRSRLFLAPLLIFASLHLLGCGILGPDEADPTGDPYIDLRSRDPSIVIAASRRAGELRDPRAIPQLIENLRSNDNNVRFWSIVALVKITNQADNRGYIYFAPEEEREAAVKRWEHWYETEGEKRFPPAVDTTARG